MKKMGVFIVIILSLVTILFFVRASSSTQIDDVHPNIYCPELEIYDVDFLYVVPNFDYVAISENLSWCMEILSLNKSLEMHGINHEPYREFLTEKISQEDLEFALGEFQKCFNQTPENFKPPQLKISQENKILVEENNLTINLFLNSVFHKVYHCNDSGKIKNRWIEVF